MPLAIGATQGSLVGAVMGPTVAATERTATVTPNADEGATVYLAVRAYTSGQAIATSDKMRLVYQPAGLGGGEGEGEGGGGETPPPQPLTAPNLVSVTQTGLTEVTASWEFVGCENCHEFEIQQRDMMANWRTLEVVMDAAARQWVGTPLAMDESLPFRAVVYNLAGESATSNERTATGEPPLQAPVLTVVEQWTSEQIHVEWTYATPANFQGFVVQQRDEAEVWHDLATVRRASDREWIGQPLDLSTTHPYRVMVYNITGESAASNEGFLTMG